MNASIVSIVFLALAAVILGLSILIGSKRGFFAALIRAVTVAVAALIAFLSKSKVLEALEGSVDLKAELVNALGSDYEGIVEFIVPIVEMIVMLLVFFLVFIVFRWLSLILYAILKAIFRPLCNKLNSRLLGLVIGAVQGLIIVACIVFPLNGIVDVAGQLIGAVGDINESMGGDSGDSMDLSALDFLTEYSTTGAGKTLCSLDDIVVNPITEMTDENGKSITLKGQIEGIAATAKLASALTQMTEINFDNPADFTPDNARELFKSLNDMKNGLSEEGLEAVNELISTAAGSLLADSGLDLDLSSLDFGAIDFEKEGDIVASLLDEEPDLSEVATLMADSDVIVDLLKSGDTTFETSVTEQENIKEALADVEGLDEAKKADIYKIFGITE